MSPLDGARLSSLDGLRGLAALVVLIHHALLTFPRLADAYYEQSEIRAVSFPWILSYTPLHAFWAGTEAVYLFFILSGIVLVLPVIRAGPKFSWFAYYPRRLVRLYVPIIAAIVFGAALAQLAARFQDPALGAWMNARKTGYTMEWLGRDLVLVFGASGVISPLWSLRWEILFSLLLPVFVASIVFLRRLWWIKLIAAFGLVFTGSWGGEPSLFFLPMFAVGALLISEWGRIRLFFDRISRFRIGWPLLLALAVVLTTIKWICLGLKFDPSVIKLVEPFAVLGVALLIIIAGFWDRAVRALERGCVAWLGRVSFSLYLIHEPIIIAARVMTFPLSPWVGLAISVPASLLVAEVFARFVERPAHSLSKRVGEKFSRLVR